jgi:hypothetical protein
MKRVLFVVLGVFLLLGAFSSSITDGIKGWRTDAKTEAFAITTGAGVTTANVTLNSDLFQDDYAEVTSVTSNVTGESPIASGYTAATNVLLIAALNPSTTHTVTVAYLADTESNVMGAVGPFLGILIFGGLIFLIFGQSKG